MPVNLNVLNKIDPTIVNNVQQQTVEGVVHTYEKTRVSKDPGKEKGNSSSHKRMKEKLDKFGSLLGTMDININFTIEDDNIIATDINGNILKTYTKDEISDLFSRMEDMIGIFIDIKR